MRQELFRLKRKCGEGLVAAAAATLGLLLAHGCAQTAMAQRLTPPNQQVTGILYPVNGGTGLNTSAATGCVSISAGVWSVSPANCVSASGVTAFNGRTGAVTLAYSDVAATFATVTGCATAGYVYSPASSACVPAGPTISAGQGIYIGGTSTAPVISNTFTNCQTVGGSNPGCIFSATGSGGYPGAPFISMTADAGGGQVLGGDDYGDVFLTSQNKAYINALNGGYIGAGPGRVLSWDSNNIPYIGNTGATSSPSSVLQCWYQNTSDCVDFDQQNADNSLTTKASIDGPAAATPFAFHMATGSTVKNSGGTAQGICLGDGSTSTGTGSCGGGISSINGNTNSAQIINGSLGIIASSTGGTTTITNSGVTSAVAGTGIGVSGATGAVTITNTAPGPVGPTFPFLESVSWGDSITAGYTAMSPLNSYAAIDARIWSIPAYVNRGAFGFSSFQIEPLVYQNTLPPSQSSLGTIMIGTNNVGQFGAGTDNVSNYSQNLMEETAFIALPASKKVYFNGGTGVAFPGGTWTSTTSFIAGSPGMKCTGNSCAATFSVTGSTVYLSTGVDNANVATATLACDGTPTGAILNFTGIGGTSLTAGAMLTRVTGLSNTTHSCTVQSTSSNGIVYLMWTAGLDGSDITSAPLEAVLEIPDQHPTDSVTPTYQAVQSSDVALLQGDGLVNIFYVADSGLFSAGNYTDNEHLNDSGQQILATALETAVGTKLGVTVPATVLPYLFLTPCTTTGSSGSAGNTWAGFGALCNNTTGVSNTAFGQDALAQNTSGSHNSGFGIAALIDNTSGSGNTALGDSSLLSLSNGSDVTGVGSGVGQSLTGSHGALFGAHCETFYTGDDALCFGAESGQYSTGTGNAFIGSRSGNENSPFIPINPTGSPFTYTFSSFGSVVVSGGTVSSVTVNGSPVFAGGFGVTVGDVMVVTYSSAPTIHYRADITSDSDITLVGTFTGKGADAIFTDSSALGFNAVITASHQIQLGDVNVTSAKAGNLGVCLSDGSGGGSCGGSGSFAPLTNPSGGQNNYAPILKPSFNGDSSSQPGFYNVITSTNSNPGGGAQGTSGIPAGATCGIFGTPAGSGNYNEEALCMMASSEFRFYYSNFTAFGSEAFFQILSVGNGAIVAQALYSAAFVNTTSGTVTATTGTGVTSVTCATASCTTERGTYTVVGGTATTGVVATLTWPTTGTAWACSVSMNGGTAFLGLGHSVATATGMTVSAGVSVIGTTFTFDYQCKP